MAEDVVIDQEGWSSAKDAAAKLKESLDNTYAKSEELLALVQGSNWKGKSRDSFLAYLELLIDRKSVV